MYKIRGNPERFCDNQEMSWARGVGVESGKENAEVGAAAVDAAERNDEQGCKPLIDSTIDHSSQLLYTPTVGKMARGPCGRNSCIDCCRNPCHRIYIYFELTSCPCIKNADPSR